LMSTGPSVTVAGAVATIVVSLLTEKVAGLLGPKLTAVALVNPLPVIVTDVTPVLGPEPGLTAVTTAVGRGVGERVLGAGGARATSGGDHHIHGADQARRGCGRDAAVAVHRDVGGRDTAKLHVVAPVKPVPVMVTEVPPVVGPEDGLTPVTAGAGGGGPVVMLTFWTRWMSLNPPVAR